MRRPYRERFRLIITELGTGLAGRPDDLQEVLRRAHPGLRETSKVLRILGDQNEVIKNFITDSDTVVTELEKNKRDVVRWVREAGDAAEISATRRNELRANFRRFPEFLDELRPDDGAARRAGGRADAAAGRPPARRARPRHLLHARRAVLGGEPPGRALARRDGRGRHARLPRGPPGDRGAAQARRRRAGVGQAAAPVPPDDRRPQARDRERPAREGDRAAGAGPDRHPGRGRLHGHGGDLELLLLADAQHQHAGRHGAHAARVAHGRAGLHRVAQRAAEDAGGPGDVRALQLVPRPEPARHLQPRPARRRLQPVRRAAARRERQAAVEPRRAARRGPARGRPAARPARPLAAADRPPARRPGPARLADPEQRQQLAEAAPDQPRAAPAGARADRRAAVTDQTTGQLLDYLLAP